SGPGDVRILQPGGANDGLTVAPASPKAGPAKPPDVDQLKLTRVMYRGKMYSDNKNRVAMFFEDVDVVHVPADNEDLAVDLDNLPVGGMHLHSDKHAVRGKTETDWRSRALTATGRVTYRSPD